MSESRLPSPLPGPSSERLRVLRGRVTAPIALAGLASSGLSVACGAPTLVATPGIYLPAEEGDGCTPAVTRIDAVDQPTPLGFTAIEVLQRLDGPRSSPLAWLEPGASDEYELTLGAEGGRSTLDVDVRAQDGPILYRYRTPLLTAPDDTECDPGALEIPVTVTLQSGAQALTESFDAVLEARVPYRGHISKQLEPGALRGGLGLAHVTSLDPARTFWLGPIGFDADLWEGGSHGSLSLQIGASHARVSSELRPPPEPPEQPGAIATWPSTTECEAEAEPLPTDAKVLGFSANDVLDELRRAGPRQVTWSDGTGAALELELGADAPELCQSVGESLGFTATLRAHGDGGLDVRSTVRVEALDAGGRVGAIRIESLEPSLPSAVEEGTLRSTAGIASEGYDSVLVGVEWTHDGTADSGSLSLRGVDAGAPDPSGVYPSTALANARW